MSLPPGPELDALVAEKIFGWRRSEDGRWIIPAGEGLMAEFSTSIAAAWEVVEKAVPWGFKIRVDDDGTWSCDFCVDSLRVGFGQAASAPHAICLAALNAVGEK